MREAGSCWTVLLHPEEKPLLIAAIRECGKCSDFSRESRKWCCYVKSSNFQNASFNYMKVSASNCPLLIACHALLSIDSKSI